MIIEIPQGYVFSKEENIIAFEENGILKLRARKGKFNDVMYDLTYQLKGNTRCYYCGRKIQFPSKTTLDHVHPKALGGPTIPQNLVPACRDCNGCKDNMTPDQFRAYKNIGNAKKQKEFKQEYFRVKYFQERWVHILPLEWTCIIPTSDVTLMVELNGTDTTKYQRIKEFHQRTGQLRRPVIVDRNKVVLDGSTEVLYAINNKIQRITTIVLENVEVIF